MNLKERSWYPWVIVALLWGVALLNYLDRQMLSTMKSAIMADIHELEMALKIIEPHALLTDVFHSVADSANKNATRWKLELPERLPMIKADPIRLRLTGGAYEGSLDLGGLALTDLYVSDGAASVKVDFSSPNAASMSSLRYETGASTVELLNLANANFASMNFRSGAGTYTLDFGGTLQRDADVDVESGLSTLTIVVPEGTAAVVEISGGLSSVNASGAWATRDSARFELEGQGPVLRIDITMGAGTVNLRTN